MYLLCPDLVSVKLREKTSFMSRRCAHSHTRFWRIITVLCVQMRNQSVGELSDMLW